MLAEQREVVGAALLACGHDPNDVSDRALGDARSLLVAQRPQVVRYDSDDFVTPVVDGQVAAHHAWSGPAAHAVRANHGLRYFVPDEGAVLWVTTAAVPSAAPDPERSAALVRELMDPPLAARSTLEHGYATPNDRARRLLPLLLREDATLFPDADTRRRCRALHDLGADETRIADVWRVTVGPPV